MTIVKGNKVTLRRAEVGDRRRIYSWLARSDLTLQMLGPPFYQECSIPNVEQFSSVYQPYFFDGTRPFDGRGFIIRCTDDAVGDIGFICHREINLLKDVVVLELWLAAERHCSRGYGSEALSLLCDWLQKSYGVNRFVLRPARRNVRALRAIRRAGFRETDLVPAEVVHKFGLREGIYKDEVLMFRILQPSSPKIEIDNERTYVFVDSEFTNLSVPRLISVGAVASDATAFYCELNGWPQDDCSEFVRKTVLPLLDGQSVPHPVAAQSFIGWLDARAQQRHTVIVSDSGFDRWALADLLGREDLPANVEWMRVPIAYESLNEAAHLLGLRRHHALDDARALRHALLQRHAVLVSE